jgi:hypothetical protein
MFKAGINIVVAILVMISPESACQQNRRAFDNDNRRLSDLYLEKTGSHREYIDGRDYFPYYFRSGTTTLLRPEEGRTASLTINGRTYEGLTLQYDTFADELIYTDDSLIYNNRVRQVSFDKYRVSSFDLFFRHDTLHFRYFSVNNDTAFNLPEGFYEVAYYSMAKYLVRHASSEVVSMNKVESYIYKPVNYICVDDGFRGIESRKQFISLFGSNSEEINRFLRQKHIRIRKAGKKQITDVLKYYESLHSGAN